MTQFLNSDPGLTLVASVAGAIWTAFKSSEWYARRRSDRNQRAQTALEAGVEQAYQTYVREIKLAREDGKLTKVERRRARDLAIEAAAEYGRTRGVDVVEELGHDYLDLWIARTLRQMKRGK